MGKCMQKSLLSKPYLLHFKDERKRNCTHELLYRHHPSLPMLPSRASLGATVTSRELCLGMLCSLVLLLVPLLWLDRS